MKKVYGGILSTIFILISTNPAFGLFTNSGFETGDPTGWTVESGRYTGNNRVNWSSSGYGTGHGRADVIDFTGTMFRQTLDIDPSWIKAGFSGGDFWHMNEVWSYDLNTLSVGDDVAIQMWVTKCNWGGHGGYVFPDGIGMTVPGDNYPVPEPATMLLFGTGLTGLACLVRKRSRK